MDLERLHRTLPQWFAEHGRDLPWRHSHVTAWGVLVSEIMLQQTPVVRVLPQWQQWMHRWPTPADLAAAPTDEVLRAWGSLGYPRRALRLQQAAEAIQTRHDGVVPQSQEELRALPGIGEYTAAAVAAFAYRRRAVVLDTNIRRVLRRLLAGEAMPAPTLTNAERSRAEQALPERDSWRWNAALMELGALICTARSPDCGDCPVSRDCAWLAAGKPADEYADRRRAQAWVGTDRQARGRIMAALRRADAPVPALDLAHEWPEADQRDRALAALVTDGLAQHTDAGYQLPR